MSTASYADYPRLHSFTPSQILPHADNYAPSEPPRGRSKLKLQRPDPNKLNLLPGQPLHTLDETSHPNLNHPDRLDYNLESRTNSPTGLSSHPSKHNMSVSEGSSGPSVFDDGGLDDSYGVGDEHYTLPTTTRATSGDDGLPGSYDLKPPAPVLALSNIELLADRLWSVDHLKVILRDAAFASRFTSFLAKYRPESSQLLARYVEIQKAVTAVEYANAVAASIFRGTALAAHVDSGFEARAGPAVEQLLADALPGYITYTLVQVVTEQLVKEITGTNTPVMRELVNGLAEVYCLSDPSLPDNPIVYASEEFYATSQYGKDYAIGRNCRFLQGPRTSGATVSRLIDALAEGKEVTELILNYRRDGSPFMNLLMIAPLYDNKGTVRYFIGAQIDVNGLIENGRGLESFERVLKQDRSTQRYGGAQSRSPKELLTQLSGMWDNEEKDIAARAGRERRTSNPGAPGGLKTGGRRYVGMDDPADKNMWPAPHLGTSGRLPGVFQNYILVRPYPSLRITFTSPALRIPGLLQSKLIDRIGGPPHIRDGVLSALSSGIGVTAKITWLASSGDQQDKTGSHLNQHGGDPLGSFSGSQASRPGSRGQASQASHSRPPGYGSQVEGRTRWLHATPLLGSDGQVGVWMVILCESESITGALNAHERAAEANAAATASMNASVTGTPHSQHHSPYPQSGPGAPLPIGSPRYAGPANPNRGKPMGSQKRNDYSERDSENRLYHQYLESERNSTVRPPLPQIPQQHQQAPRSMNGDNVSSAGQRAASRAASASRGGGKETHEAKAARAKVLAERAMIGEDTFRDF